MCSLFLWIYLLKDLTIKNRLFFYNLTTASACFGDARKSLVVDQKIRKIKFEKFENKTLTNSEHKLGKNRRVNFEKIRKLTLRNLAPVLQPALNLTINRLKNILNKNLLTSCLIFYSWLLKLRQNLPLKKQTWSPVFWEKKSKYLAGKDKHLHIPYKCFCLICMT